MELSPNITCCCNIISSNVCPQIFFRKIVCPQIMQVTLLPWVSNNYITSTNKLWYHSRFTSTLTNLHIVQNFRCISVSQHFWFSEHSEILSTLPPQLRQCRLQNMECVITVHFRLSNVIQHIEMHQIIALQLPGAQTSQSVYVSSTVSGY